MRDKNLVIILQLSTVAGGAYTRSLFHLSDMDEAIPCLWTW